jgi:hypothetical protein
LGKAGKAWGFTQDRRLKAAIRTDGFIVRAGFCQNLARCARQHGQKPGRRGVLPKVLQKHFATVSELTLSKLRISRRNKGKHEKD